MEVEGCEDTCQRKGKGAGHVDNMNIEADLQSDCDKDILGDALAQYGDDHRNLHVSCASAAAVVNMAPCQRNVAEYGVSCHGCTVSDDIRIGVE